MQLSWCPNKIMLLLKSKIYGTNKARYNHLPIQLLTTKYFLPYQYDTNR